MKKTLILITMLIITVFYVQSDRTITKDSFSIDVINKKLEKVTKKTKKEIKVAKEEVKYTLAKKLEKHNRVSPEVSSYNEGKCTVIVKEYKRFLGLGTYKVYEKHCE